MKIVTWIKNNRLLSILLLVAIGFFAYYIFKAVQWLPYINSVDYGEPYVMNYAKLWANGQWKWDITIPPYLTMVYGIGYEILVYPFVKMFGAELWVGRSISFVSALVVCFIIYLIAKNITSKKSYGLLASLLPATQPFFRDWSLMARVDMPAVMFDMIGFYLVTKLKDSKYVYLAIIPFLFAIMIKLTAVAGLAAVVIYLLIYNRKKLAIFLPSFAVCLIAVVLWLEIISGGAYLRHIVTYNNTIENIYLGVFLFLLNWFVYPFMIIGVLSIAYIKKCWKDRNWALPCLLFITALIIDLFTTLRPGAAGLYYFEAIIASSICASIGLFYLIKSWSKGKPFGVANIVIIGIFVFMFAIYAPKSNVVFPDKQYDDDVKTIQSIVGDSTKPVISENPTVPYTMGKDLYVEFFIFTNMARLGTWDETPYIEKYQTQYFDYVILRLSLEQRMKDMEKGVIDGDFTDDVLKAINDNYTLIYQTENNDFPCGMFVYEANNRIKNDSRLLQEAQK